MCKASIIIPAYNAADFIAQTIDSILAQTFSDFECIIIDDGSKDETLSVISTYHDKRIKVIAQQNSGGPAKPRNIGMAAAQGEYIFIFDSDDVMHVEKLALSIAALDAHPNADLLFTNFSSIDESDNLLKENFLAEYDTFWKIFNRKLMDNDVIEMEHSIAYPALIKTNYIGTSSVVLRRSALHAHDAFNESIKNADDYLFWATFLKTHKFIYLNAILHQYRIQPGSISNRSYLNRGPGRITVITTLKNNCTDSRLIKILAKKLSNEYISMSYTYKTLGNHKEQFHYARKSFQTVPNIRAIKLLIHAFVKRALNM